MTARYGALLATVLLVLAGCGATEQVAPATGGPDVHEYIERALSLEPVAASVEGPVRVRGRVFQSVCVGQGEPAVILVSGHAVDQTTWDGVRGRLGSATKVCSYDRLGIGSSDPLPERQTFATFASDLDGVLHVLEPHRPVVVVGHSLGGPIAMTWATSHPDQVAGVVLVDAASPQYTREVVRQLPDPPGTTRKDMIAGDAEHVDHVAAWPTLQALPRLGEIPLVVLTHGHADPNLFPPQADWDRLEAAWLQGQHHWLASDNAALVTAERSGHLIQLDEPELVVAAVLSELDA
jgi:pimeloyl-ACP methyl ester carboxylesterase